MKLKTWDKHKKLYAILLLLALGAVTRFAFLGHPNETVFDEVHFGKFISGYYTHEYFFDIHPPLGKLTIAGFGKLFDFRPGFSFAEIGQKFPDKTYIALRFLPSLAGTLLPLAVYLLAGQLGLSQRASLVAGLFILFDNAILAQSRYILLDSFLLLFGVLCLYFYLKARRGGKWSWLAMGVFGALAASIKWTGLSFLALAGIIELIDFFKLKRYRDVRKILSLVSCLLLLPFLIYFSLFALHFSLLYKSGPGDAFMSPEFRKTLQGSQDSTRDDIQAANLFQKFLELNAEMYRANQGLTATHPYSSPWYTWPFMTRSIFYWINGNERIYLIGNPFVWLASTFAMLWLLLSLNPKKLFQDPTARLIVSGYVLNLLPFIGVKRVMFLYHYFPALIFAVIALAYLIEQSKKPKRWLLVSCLLSLVAFLYFAPLTYGLSLSPKAYENRVWLEGWR